MKCLKCRHESSKSSPKHKVKGFYTYRVYVHVRVNSNIVPCVCKARPWTACTVSQQKQEGPARSPPKPAPQTKTHVLLPSSAEVHVSDEAHFDHSDNKTRSAAVNDMTLTIC